MVANSDIFQFKRYSRTDVWIAIGIWRGYDYGVALPRTAGRESAALFPEGVNIGLVLARLVRFWQVHPNHCTTSVFEVLAVCNFT
jgi:hypothetical protein